MLAFSSLAIGPSLYAQEELPKPNARELAFFEQSIRPLLVKHCYDCHSVESGQAEGGLRVDSAAALRRGGKGGPAIVPGYPERSMLILAIKHEQPAKPMPPKDAGEKLSDAEIELLVRWVRNGAADPRKENKAIERQEKADFYAPLKEWWAYQPIKNPPAPTADSKYSDQVIDQFVRAAQIAAGTKPVGPADADTLLRRVYYDVIGLPPTVEQAKQFHTQVTEKGLDAAYAALVDSLLASDQYGMHWGRHWLDVARYGESSGRDINAAYPNAWRYRNWVVKAYNNDMPYDQFLIKQIAGDLLNTKGQVEAAENLTATGFLAMGSRALNERNPRQFAVDQADEQIDATFQATMGLTFACARCHDHKFDPITQRDYTAVSGIFLSTKTHYGTTATGMQNRNESTLTTLPAQADQEKLEKNAVAPSAMAKDRERLATLDVQIAQKQREFLTARRNKKDVDQNELRQFRFMQTEASQLRSVLSNVDSKGNPLALAMTVEDLPADAGPRRMMVTRRFADRESFREISDSPLFVRGEISMAADAVPRHVPELFGKGSRFEIPEGTSGRLQLARWIASDANPMTARVAANRIWTWIFDEPIVASVDNFGTSGSAPTNPELLDYLASKLMQSRWSQKTIIREILLSKTYRSSSVSNAENAAKDPDNATLWHANRKRLPAEAIRDSMLVFSGSIDPAIRVGSEIAEAGDSIVRLQPEQARARRFLNRPNARLNRGAITSDGVNYRSVFLAYPRGESYELFELFDAPEGSMVQGRRDATNVPTQSLYLLNNAHVQTYATDTAESIVEHAGQSATREDKVKLLFQTILCRPPSESELKDTVATLDALRGDQTQALASLAKVLFATAEFRYVE